MFCFFDRCFLLRFVLFVFCVFSVVCCATSTWNWVRWPTNSMQGLISPTVRKKARSWGGRRGPRNIRTSTWYACYIFTGVLHVTLFRFSIWCTRTSTVDENYFWHRVRLRCVCLSLSMCAHYPVWALIIAREFMRVWTWNWWRKLAIFIFVFRVKMTKARFVLFCFWRRGSHISNVVQNKCAVEENTVFVCNSCWQHCLLLHRRWWLKVPWAWN